jgi:hypothetical protein
MNQYDALRVLGLAGEVTPELIKKAYKQACSQYHPDKNPAGLEMMKLVNVAYDTLKSYDGIASISSSSASYGTEVSEALNHIISFGLTIEVCGAWVWVSGDTKSYKGELKKAGFIWAPKKKCWYFKPADAKRSRSFGQYSMEKIRDKYGSQQVNNRAPQRLQS